MGLEVSLLLFLKLRNIGPFLSSPILAAAIQALYIHRGCDDTAPHAVCRLSREVSPMIADLAGNSPPRAG